MNENNAILDVNLGGRQYGIFFFPKDNDVFSANSSFDAIAIFDSPIIDGGDGFVSWKEINIDCDQFDNNKIHIYIRSSESNSTIEQSSWVGPILKYEGYDISNIKNKFLQIRTLISTNELATQSPKINKILISCFKLGKEETFFTKALNLGFKPKHMLLTYNGQITEEVMVRFAIAGSDTIDKNKYHIIEPDKIEDISNLVISNKLKLMLSGIGNRTIPFVIDEFSFIISGDDQVVIT